MSIKTVTIQWYPLFQANGWACHAAYRGKMIHETMHVDKSEARQQTEIVCKVMGFTHARIKEENAWGKVTSYTVKLK